MALFAQNYIQRQDQLRQQQIEEEQRRQQAAQLELQNQRQREQMDLQLRQQQSDEDTQRYNRDRLERQDALKQRNDEVNNALSPQMNSFMQGVTADLQRYAPTLSDGRPNPQYNQALFMAARARSDQARKLWSAVTLAVGAGQGYEEAKQSLLGFVGGDTTPAPLTPITTSPVTPAATATPASAAPQLPAQTALPAAQPTTPTPEPRGAMLGNAPEPTDTPRTPARSGTEQPTAALPQDVRKISLDQLLTLDDQTLLNQYGEPGLQYANAARTQYRAELRARADAAQAANIKLWDTQFEQLAKDPNLTATQRAAMHVITQLNQKPAAEVTDEDRQLFSQAINDLAPAMYTASAWNKLLEDGDPNAILSALPIYQKLAPDVVQGFNVAPWQAKQEQDRREAEARIREIVSQTTERDTLLPGKRNAQTLENEGKGIQNDTAAVDLGVKQLAGIASSPLSWQQMARTNPALWYQMKQNLGLTDTGLANLYTQAQYKYGLGVKGEELTNQLRAAQVAGANADRGLTIARTSLTLEEIKTEVATRDGKIQKLNADIALAQAQGRNTDSMTAERDRLVNEREALLQSQAAQASSAASLNWARITTVQQDLKLDREKTAAYVKSVEGKYAVDMAQILSLGASTALKRAQNPNDPLYNPLVVTSKPGDPMDLLKKKADIYYVPMQRALDAAAAQQRTIDSLVKQYTGASGSVDMKRLQADPQYVAAVKARDAAIKGAQDYRQKGDNVVTGSMNSLGDNAVPAPALGKTGTPFKVLTAAPGVQVATVSTALVKRMDNLLTGWTAPGGLIPVITQGIRTKEEQDALYAKGRTVPGPNASPKKPMGDIVTNAKGGESNHNGGNAVDISWKDPKTGKVLAGTDPRAQAAWKALGARAPQFGLRWGGTFPGLVDMYHFEVYGQPKATSPAPAAAAPTAKPPSTPTASTPLPGVKRPRLSTADLAVASRAEQALLRAVKSGDGNAQYAMYTQLVQFGYDSGAVLAFIKANQGAK